MTFTGAVRLDGADDRERARRIRDHHWSVLRKAVTFGQVWVDPWNRSRRDEAPDEERFCLISGSEFFMWLEQHPDWTEIGQWDAQRAAYPIRLTPAGRAAVDAPEQFDLEPVFGGLVEPGWSAVPAPRVSS